jgi:hypothetical protein
MSIWYSVRREKHKIKATTVRLEPQDREAIERIKELYGCPSDVAAIRLALRMTSRGEVSLPITPRKERRFHPHG